MILRNKRLFIILSLTTSLLLVPYISMFFTNEVNWSRKDFILAGIILLSTGLTIELVIRKVNKKRNQLILLMCILALLLILWIELAVGVFGTPLAGS